MTPGEQMGGEPPHQSDASLVTFLYLICRDLIQCGEIEKYVIQSKPGPLTNRFLAEYAENMAERLQPPEEQEPEQPPELDPRIEGMEDALVILRRELAALPATEARTAQLELVDWLIPRFGIPSGPDPAWDKKPSRDIHGKPLGIPVEVSDFIRLGRP